MKGTQDEQIKIALAYIHGRVEVQLEGFARSLGVPTAELARRLGALLQATPGGEVLGVEHRMPNLRRKATKRGKGAGPVEVADDAHDARPSVKMADKRKKWTAGRRKEQAERMRQIWRRKKKEGQ